MIIMKFGGTSLADRERVMAAAKTVAGTDQPVVIVVSALGGTTDSLLKASVLAEAGEVLSPPGVCPPHAATYPPGACWASRFWPLPTA